MIALPLLLLAAAAPGPVCPVAKLTPADRATTAALLSRSPEGKVRPGDIGKVLTSGAWRAIWATPKDSERGVYFVRKTAKGGWRYVYTWGGVIPPDERASTIGWMRKHVAGLPTPLATCVVDAVIAE